MAVVSRDQLKKSFSKGAIPSQEDFSNLVDSLFHKQDDGLISPDDGLQLSPKGSSGRLMTFFHHLSDFKPKWSVEQYPKNSANFGLNIVDREKNSALFIQHDGNIGVGTMTPTSKLEVAGNVTAHGRRGMYAAGEVPGDGKWHTITPVLNQCHAFEIIAKIGKPGRGLYAMVHAIALSTFGRSKNKIKTTDAHYGSWNNTIALRWSGYTFNYFLQMRTRRNYGDESMIKYYITNLWWEDE